MRYAHADTVYHLLDIDPLLADAATLLAIDNVEEGVAALIDQKCRRTFGEPPLIEQRDISFPQASYAKRGVIYDRILMETGEYFFPNYGFSSEGGWIHASPYGMKNVTRIASGGSWDGSGWDGELVHDPTTYFLTFVDSDGWAHGLVLTSAPSDQLRVTATWENGATSETVPPEIREAATFLTCDEYRILLQSPAGEIGPPGLATFIRNAWNFEKVKTAIERNTFRQIVV